MTATAADAEETSLGDFGAAPAASRSQRLPMAGLLLAALVCSFILPFTGHAQAADSQAPEIGSAEPEPPQEGGSASGAAAVATLSGMADYYELIYQVRVVARNAGSKSSIGSGFQVSPDGLIVTNYHVVSLAVNSPETHRIEYLEQSGESGELTLLDFDVVNDLAVLRHPAPRDRHFTIDSSKVGRGDMIYALGNPHDLGITLKTGAFNGMVEHSYNPQILFSGSLNPGMSGGPGLLANGAVVGVNVATAGSDLSFLVPAEQLQTLIHAQREVQPEEYQKEIAEQVRAWQEQRYEDLLDRDWQRVEFGDWPALDEIRYDMQCWGRSNEDDDELTVVDISKGCDSGNRLFLGDNFGTGHIHYSFGQSRALELSALRFHYTSSNSMYPDNSGDDTKLTGFECQSDFVNVSGAESADGKVPDGSVTTSLCTRGYIEMPGLFDVLLLATLNEDTESYTAHFALAGVPQELAMQFMQKFFASLGWQ